MSTLTSNQKQSLKKGSAYDAIISLIPYLTTDELEDLSDIMKLRVHELEHDDRTYTLEEVMKEIEQSND